MVICFLKNESGATAIEYALIAAGVGLAISAAASGLGTQISTFFTAIGTKLSASAPK